MHFDQHFIYEGLTVHVAPHSEGATYTVTDDCDRIIRVFVNATHVYNWLIERGLSIDRCLPENEGAVIQVHGAYRTMAHNDRTEFLGLPAVRVIRELKFGMYRLGMVTEDPDGACTVHVLFGANAPVFDWDASFQAVG